MEALEFSETEVDKVRKSFDKDPQTIKDDVEILKNWMKQQRHLPQDPDDGFLERVLLRNKFRIEQAKKKLDNYYTLRGLYKHFYREFNAEVVPSKQVTFILPLPKLTLSLERILIWKIKDLDPDKFNYTDVLKYFNLLMEILTREDYSVGDTVIMDWEGATLDHFKKITVTEMSAALDLYIKAYSGRILGLHCINSPSYINIFIGMLRIVLPKKLQERIRIHKDLDSLYECFEKRVLPKDFGGDLESIVDVARKWDNVFKSYYDFLDANYRNVSNESLRIGDVPQNEVFGVDGTFKKLNLD